MVPAGFNEQPLLPTRSATGAAAAAAAAFQSVAAP